MQIHKIEGRLERSAGRTEVVTQEGIAWIQDRVKAGDVIIVTGAFSKAQVLAVRAKVHRFGAETAEKNPDRSAQTVAFHRIDHNHPKMSVQRIAHFFRFSYADPGDTGIFDFFEPLNTFRNDIASLPRDFTFTQDWNGFLSQPAVLHYPVGGGYMQEHMDPVYPQFVEMVMIASRRGEDYHAGGLEIKSGDQWVDVEGNVDVGDLVLFRPDVPHRVKPIDESLPMDWKAQAGRWIIFSPIANIRDESVNEKATSRY